MQRVSFFGFGMAFFLTVALIVLCVEFVDRPVALFAYAHIPYRHELIPILNAELLLVPLGALSIFGCGLAAVAGYELPRLAAVSMVAGFSLMWALACNFFFLQPVFGRIDVVDYLKHNDNYGFVLLHGHGGAGFPSGHSVLASSFLLVFFHFYPRARAFIVAAIGVVMITLVLAEWHFVSDTIGGVFIGAVTALLTSRLWSAAVRTNPKDVTAR